MIGTPLMLCALALATPGGASSDKAATPADSATSSAWFARHAFIGSGGSLAVMPGQRLAQGDSVLVFRVGRLERRRIAYMIDADSAKRAYEDLGPRGVEAKPELWSRIGAYWFLGNSNPTSLAQYHDLFDTPGDAVAFEGLPTTALAIGGAGVPLAPKQLNALRAPLTSAAPRAMASKKVRRVGQRFRSPRGGDLVEVLIGVPYRPRGDKARMDSVQVHRVFLRGNRVLAVERFTRTSGGTGAPQLDDQNWFQTTRQTLGVLSLDGGATWNLLDMNLGFEGIVWTITRLEQGMPPLWEGYLYVIH